MVAIIYKKEKQNNLPDLNKYLLTFCAIMF